MSHDNFVILIDLEISFRPRVLTLTPDVSTLTLTTGPGPPDGQSCDGQTKISSELGPKLPLCTLGGHTSR